MREILDRGHEGLVKQVDKWEKMSPDERAEHLKELGGVLYIFRFLNDAAATSLTFMSFRFS